ncbi:CoA ester lyase [Rhodococcus opacus]|uniref:CoA ester lyase n=1 Tax=Rhodococcus opacus TaxID=37919 RepID=A0AAX3YTU4_RHOOP|nr:MULTISPECIES: CoA ester lyase [Rhodococcus]MCZ4586182.1 CoA ester lyase [Rhodococcus opacus]QSE86033.1 CoA ester lyase [Rhodococcus koreensis]WLF51884.1 CoA ester lyase [Rhodococcus opacus]
MTILGPGPSLLFCPGDRGDRFDKALGRADVVIFDLEDAIAPEQKDAARAQVAAAAAAEPDRAVVRINAADTPWFDDDVAAMRAAGVRTLMLPKASRSEQLRALHGFDVIALCETAAGVLAAPRLAAEANCVALMWGGEDLVADIGGRSSRGPDGRYRPMIEQARATVLFAAAAEGKAAIDAVHIDISDLDGLRHESIEAAAMGFRAKACIHPGHVPPIREAFRATDDQIEWAQSVLAHPDASTGGVFRLGDQMIDAPLIAHAHTIIERTISCTSN